MKVITTTATPVTQATLSLVGGVVNLGLLFGWYTWTSAQQAGVNVVVLAFLGFVSALRAGAQTAGRLVDTTKPPSPPGP